MAALAVHSAGLPTLKRLVFDPQAHKVLMHPGPIEIDACTGNLLELLVWMRVGTEPIRTSMSLSSIARLRTRDSDPHKLPYCA